MWRNLSPQEKEAMKKARSPLFKAITLAEVLVLIFPIGFGIGNFSDLLSGVNSRSVIGLIVDIVLAAVIIFGVPRIKAYLNSDVDKDELVISEAVIDRMNFVDEETVVITQLRKKDSLSHYIELHLADSPGECYRVKVDTNTFNIREVGDTVRIVCSRDEIDEKNMLVLEGE